MGSPVTTSRCYAPSSVQMSWEFRGVNNDQPVGSRPHSDTGPQAWKSTDESFFIFCFRGSCKNGICIYICVRVRRYIYTLYVLSTVSIVTSCFFLFNHPSTGFATMVLQLPDTGRELDGIQPSRSKTVQLEAPLGVAWGEQCSKPWFVNWGVLPKQW